MQGGAPSLSPTSCGVAPLPGSPTLDSVHCAPAPGQGAGGEATIVEHRTGHRKAPRARQRDGDDRRLIGWSEYVDLPDWGIRGLRAKIDTGARNSALHVENVEELARGHVRFDVILHRRRRDRRVHVVARVLRRARVRSSSGHFEPRVFVSTRLCLGGVEREVEMSLVDRERMVYRMLIGRSALSGAFLIDPTHRGLLGRPSRGGASKRGTPHSSSGSSSAP